MVYRCFHMGVYIWAWQLCLPVLCATIENGGAILAIVKLNLSFIISITMAHPKLSFIFLFNFRTAKTLESASLKLSVPQSFGLYILTVSTRLY